MTDNPSTEEVFGSTVRFLRQELGWSQQDLADSMKSQGFDWRQTTVSKTEAAERPIRLNEAEAVARLFGIHLSNLLMPVGLNPTLDHARAVQRANAARSAYNSADAELEAAEAEVARTLEALHVDADDDLGMPDTVDDALDGAAVGGDHGVDQ